MTTALIWTAFPLLGFFLALLPKPKIVFTALGILSVVVTIYVLSTFESDTQNLLSGVALIAGPMAAALVCAGALAGRWSRSLAARGRKHYTLIMIAAVLGAASFIVFDSSRQERASVDEKQLAAEFVKNNDVIVQNAGAASAVSLIMSTARNDTVASYAFSVRGTRKLYAVVEVSRPRGKPVFTLACIAPLNSGQRDGHEDSCRR